MITRTAVFWLSLMNYWSAGTFENVWTSVCLVQNKEKTLAVVIWIILTWLCLPVPTLGLSVSVIADCQCCSLQSSFSSAPVLPCLAVSRLLTTVSWNIKTNQSAVHGGRHLWSRTSQQGSDSTRAKAEQLWHQNWQLSGGLQVGRAGQRGCRRTAGGLQEDCWRTAGGL